MSRAPQATVKVGQIWKEMDPRLTRFVLVLSLEVGVPYQHDRAVVKTCSLDGELAGGPASRIRLDRFKGSARTGFQLVRDVA